MNGFVVRHWFKLLIGVLCILLIAVLIYTKTGSPKLEVLDQAPDFELTDLQQNKVTLQNTNGKVRLVYFYFASCPDVCPPTTYMLSKVQDGLKDIGVFGKEAAILSITFDPKRDTPQKLQEFAGRYNADPSGWHFLHGDEQYSKELAKQFKVMVIKDDKGEFAHSNLINLIDKEGNVRKRYRVGDQELDNENMAQSIVEDMVSLSGES